MKELVLHIGQGKCASSSIQAYLSHNPVLEAERRYTYYCILPGGRPIGGSAVTGMAAQLPSGFVSSVVDFEDPSSFFKGLQQIKRLGVNEAVVVSNEALGNLWLNEQHISAFDALDVPIRIFMLTRPPADWLNSAWWQWGCWSDSSVDEWISCFGPSINYVQRLQPWLSLKRLEDVYIADISQNPIGQFNRFLGIAQLCDHDEWMLNRASSADLLRFLINNKRILNRSVHNPNVEFELNRAVEPSGGGLPFVLTKQMVSDAINASRDDHETLLKDMHWNEGIPSVDVVARYLDEESYDDLYCDFSLETFLRQEPSKSFLIQVNDWLLGRLSSLTEAGANFDAVSYLTLNPDVAIAGANPYEHYLLHGMAEGRAY